MEQIVPQKRPTSPLIPTDPCSSSSTKQAKPDATSPSSDPTITIKGYKVPKQFRNWQGQEKVAREMGGLEASYLDTKLEVDDSNEYEESLLAFEALIAESAYPTRQQTRSLLALCLFPLLFKPPTRISQFAKATQSSSSTTTKPLLLPFMHDPFETSHKKIRESALGVLGDLIETNGVGVVCRSIKGYGGLRKRKREQTEETEDPFAKPPSPPPRASTSTKKKGKGAKSVSVKKPSNPDSSEEEDLDLSDGDDVLAVSAKRMGNSENLWDVLAGTTAKKPRVWKRENPVAEGGWEVLRCLVEGWEVENEKNRQESYGKDTEIKALSLLRYFKPSATASDTRELSSKALDTAFWPFSDFAQTKNEEEENDSDSDMDSNDDGSLFSDDEDWGKAKGRGKGKSVTKGKGKVEEEDVKFEGGMNLSEKKEVGTRLLALIGECATNGHLDGAATLAEFTQRMKALDHVSFASFLDLFSLHAPLNSAFLPRLLSFYLESHSHPLSATTSLSIPSIASLSSSTLSATSSSDLLTSPRKRALAAQNSLLSVNGDSPSSQSQSQMPTKSKEQVSKEFWQIPNIGSTDFLVLLSRIPIEVSLPQVSSTAGGGGRKPKPIKGNFARAQKASECHRLVKEVLLQCKVEETKDTEMKEKEFESIREVLEDVERVVEESRERMK